MRALSTAAALLLCLGAAAPAAGEDAAVPSRCVKVIPARSACVEREIEIPAVMARRCIPLFEDVEVPVVRHRKVPVYLTRRVPVFESVEVPCFKVRRVPVFTTRRTPVFEEVEVPVFRAERTPVTREVCDPCTGCMRTVCTHEVRVVQCGTRIERRIKDFEEERVQCGWRPERFQDGTRTVRKVVRWEEERVECTFRWEPYEDGTRIQKRPAGVRYETYEARPARTVKQTERITLPCRRVTVVPDGTEGADALPGTDGVLTASEYAAALR